MKKEFLVVILLIFISVCLAAEFNYKFEIDIAKHYEKYGYLDKAKEHFIRVFHNPKTPDEAKSEALYQLGQISYEIGDFIQALDEWEVLINDFPESKETGLIDERIPEIRKTVSRATQDQLSALAIANDFHRHNFSDRAKEKFLNIYHDPHTSEADKAEALYLIGQITFEEGDYTVALEDWEIMIERYPDSKQTQEIANRLPQLREIITSDSDTSIISVVAKSYLKNGDFWSNAKNTFNIDYSWMPSVELATKWYDQVMKEFPNSTASEIAYRKKLFALLGWKEAGRDGDKYGAMENFKKYMPEIVETFNSFQKEYPKSQFLQGFRYQIAQTYWFNKDWKKAKIWLNKVVEAGAGNETFYTETAKTRLKKLKY
ncbi:MAG: tetratricopeptide repeat protein [Candidatus Cloacimonetes bacterium]|nr:tetratricopeptide repeat protein [Candidatus Cloacimonadota bacterium]